MSTVQSSTTQQVPSMAAFRDVRDVNEQEGPLADRREITDSTAVTIAALWQSPGYEGKTLAALASGIRVDLNELIDDAMAARRKATEPLDRTALDCLATWALNHPSRQD